ncbi:HlyD family efflux transporter periplasmic adaptor subunit [Alcanivorax sp. VBW004]|jgi:cobalt-zinc-cadmium efflux system membrane fusion protein|uniref:efflux RND transporter periplasmic adaptor subunit n=1 Tax=Alcanivorax sp. VBW004 TaxID=1287708 RepID=UPI0012BC5EF8|nr:efflux RND transporter periplasmic adaptor subunit [Alcanivorax sp. VBW004]MCG8438491.1 efflux RND transporter periplasmic adaptor subunit [Pseudomonadales bacterium]MCK5887634.1 efflux RND transporter periplasmic adaptor subunit [Alcanivorax sp.]MCK5919311.1 efflux RND transporter periplasmic adaptor subunit [Methylococcales bacterium]MTT54246.1 HlyD family efflux transporter periplasmic adaptor subunit [Alcanivorax sp. VBW004]|tara:strand:+ start:2950 stop:3957 length:1008 start_codon:yes stop_codon:yes gene_type:complete
MKNYYLLVISSVFFLSNTPAFSASDHNHEHEASEQHAPHHEEGDHDEHEDHVDHDEDGHDHDEHEHGEENSSRIEDKMASKVGIVTSVSGPQELHQTITVFGSIVSAPEQMSHVRARFEGLVKTVKVTLGDRVKAGDVLAEIESNESLKTYTIRSPITGRVVQRHANTGEVTQDQVLFSIANFDTVWAELRVYPAQQSSVSEGQAVHLLTGSGSVASTVDHILPSIESPYQLARVKLANDKQSLSPGLMTEARIEVGRFSVALAVAKDAVQTLGGRQGVFVKQGEEYRFTPLVLGRSDDHFYEVVEGLEAGSDYVSQNSYLIKADIEKSEAEHEH